MLLRISVVTLLVACAAVYLEFGADVRMPRSSLGSRGGLVTHNHQVPERVPGAIAALKAKYGPGAQVRQLPTDLIVERDGQLVTTQPTPSAFHEALGMTQVVDDAGVVSTFPFHVSPNELRDSVLPLVVPMLKMRVGPIFAGGGPEFDLDDFSIEQCRTTSPPELGLGLTARLLHLGSSTTCTSVWKHPPFRRMLVGIAVADGGSWTRPFARGACRILSNAWLASDRRQNARQPDYLECLLVDSPDNQPFGSGISAFAYEVRRNGSLAALLPDPTVLREAHLAPDPRLPTFKQTLERLDRER